MVIAAVKSGTPAGRRCVRAWDPINNQQSAIKKGPSLSQGAFDE